MKKVCLLLLIYCLCADARAQTVAQRLAQAVQSLEKDPQMESAIISIYVADRQTGALVYEKNSRFGVAPASTQKLFTAAAALAMLGSDYRYKTTLTTYRDLNTTNSGNGYITITPSGDPSLGSPRYSSTTPAVVLAKWKDFIATEGKNISWQNIFVVPPDGQEVNDVAGVYVPDGYIWQDIGNYYGAGVSGLNWNENQYDIVFRTQKPGTPAIITKINPRQTQLSMRNEAVAGASGTGDNAYVYAAPYSGEAIIRGTLPPMRNEFSISGSMPDPAFSCIYELSQQLKIDGITADSILVSPRKKNAPPQGALLGSVDHFSPTLDSLVFWFLHKSINLYGEAFIRTLALQLPGRSARQGTESLKAFWISNGIRASELNLYDGSGLSPQNRVTTRALTKVLCFAAKQPWSASFADALPTYNGMKMKSGSINGARAYAGYHRSGAGKNYAFAIVINNYSGSASAAVSKMYKVLDELK